MFRSLILMTSENVDPKYPIMAMGKVLVADQFMINLTNVIQLSGDDVTSEVEYVTNSKGHVAEHLNFEKFINSYKHHGVFNFRCRMYRAKCKPRLTVDAAAPLVKLKQFHNHKSAQQVKTNIYLNAVSIKRFRRNSTDGAFFFRSY